MRPRSGQMSLLDSEKAHETEGSPSRDPSSVKVQRGALYVNVERQEAWEKMVAIAHEGVRSEAEAMTVMTDAARLAVEAHTVRRTPE